MVTHICKVWEAGRGSYHKFETSLIYMESFNPIQIERLYQKQNNKKSG